jgi:hypothetical protein
MELLDSLKATLDQLTEKQFRTYVFAAIGGFFILILLIFFYYYRSSSSLYKQLSDLNTLRSKTVKDILATAERIKKQKEKIDAMLADDQDFKFGEYLENVLAKLRLSEKKDIGQKQEADVNGKYVEHIYDIKLNDINMKQLAEFLLEIEKNRRVYTKKIEITKSKTTPNSLEANITIATLFPKVA